MHLTEKALFLYFLSDIIGSEDKTKKDEVFNMNVINAEKLTKRYGDFTAVNGISFQVRKGELIGFLGVNGAGKSTTINMLSTLLAPTEGSAEICGVRLGVSDKEIRRKIGIVYQQNCLDDILTVRENLVCRGILHGATKPQARERLKELTKILSLGDILGKRYSTLSGGQKRRCEIAAALMHTPEILFLDEPTTGLDPATRRDVWKTIEELRKDTGMTVFLTTHYMEEAAGADRIIIISKGSIIAEGTPFQLKEKYASDTVKLYCNEREAVLKLLSEEGITATEIPNGLKFSVKETIDALPFIDKVSGNISGFEVIQGNMDDVFLNAVGEDLVAEE